MASVLDDPAISLARLTVAQYHQMVKGGVLLDGDPLELFEGVLGEKLSEGPAHSFRISQIARLLIRSLGNAGWQVRVQNPITTDDSEPEPDLAIVVDLDYSQRHPGGADVSVVIEVAGSSLVRDRSTKQRMYANADIAQYVIINLVDSTIESYTEPHGGDRARYGRHETLTAGMMALGPVTVDIASLLGN